MPKLAVLLCAALAATGFAGAGAARITHQAAQGAQPMADQAVYTYVALWDVPRADWADIEKFYKDARPALNKLVASGTIVAYGNARAWVHDSSGFTHANWVTASSFAQMDAALKAIRDALPQPAAFGKSKHVDEVLRSTVHGGKPGASGTGMLWVAQYAVKPGQMDAFSQLFESQLRPLFEEQVAAGTILSYSLNFHAVHEEDPGGVSVVYLLPDAAAIDKFQAALVANEVKNPELGAAMLATMDFASHRDSIFEVLSFGQK